MDFLMNFLRILDVIYNEFLNFWPVLLILSYKRLSYKKKACIRRFWGIHVKTIGNISNIGVTCLMYKAPLDYL